MDELMVKLAELLEISVEGAQQLYPYLRQQFIWFEGLGLFIDIATLLFIVSLIAISITIPCKLYESNDLRINESLNSSSQFNYWNKEIASNKTLINFLNTILKISVIISVVSGILLLTLNITRLFMAPDLLMLLKLLG